MASDSNPAQEKPQEQPPLREINFKHSKHFVPVLQHARCSLLVSTYAAGKVAAVGTGEEGLRLSFSNFQQAMGVAVGPRGVAVGGTNMIWILRDAEKLCSQIEPEKKHDRAFLARESFVTGNIHVHEMGWGNSNELWIVNTLFSCICSLHEDFNFVPRWKPSFITDYAAQDRCHLNGMCLENGRPKYVTALGISNEEKGWRDDKAKGGVIIDVDSGEVVTKGLCMPHSPRIYNGQLYVLDSGRGQLVAVDVTTGKRETITDFPGYGRGMAMHGQFAFICMSKARETSVFGGVPICEDRSKMRCGVVVVDLIQAKAIAYLEFETGVEELFSVEVLAETTSPVICGPYPKEDQTPPVWVIPVPSQVPDLLAQSDEATVSRRL